MHDTGRTQVYGPRQMYLQNARHRERHYTTGTTSLSHNPTPGVYTDRMAKQESTAHRPWDFLEEFRGTHFNGQWPTLPELFRITATRFPDSKAFTTYDPEYATLTYGQALETIDRLAQYLRSLGVEHGDRVAVTGKNSPEWAVAYLATLFAGAIVVPIDYQLHDEEIENLIAASQSHVLIVDEERFDTFDEKRNALNVAHVLSLSSQKQRYVYDLETGTEHEIQPATEEELAAIMYTSGTTGRPKGVMLTHRNFVADCFLAQSNLTIYPQDVFYALLPIHHSYSMLAVFIESFSVGAETVFGKRMAVSQILHDLKAARVTMFLGVPLLFNKLIAGIMRGVKEKGAIAYGLIRTLMWISGVIKKTTGVNPGKKLFGSVLEKA